MKRITKIEENKVLSIKKLRVAGYARVSTSSDEQLISLEAQKAYYEKYIKSNEEWEYAGLYYDEGITGTKKEVRDGLSSLITDCEQGLIDMVITKSISRFCRNTADCLELVRKLLGLKVTIIFEKENINTGTMESELMLSILSSLAESESVSISENNKWGAKKRFEKGSFIISYPPYGYKNENGNMVVVDEEATIVKDIFAKTLAGVGTHAIAKELNARNVKTKKGGNWSAGTVNAIIKNEKYTGDVIFQKTYTDSSFKRHTNYGEQDQYLCEDHHEAIVNHDIFNKANDMLLQRAKEKGNIGGTDKYQKRYSFSGRIKCGECGSTFKRRIHYKPSGSYIAWCCNKHIDDKDACSMKYITDDGIKLAFATMVNKLIFSRQLILKPLMNNLQGLEDNDRLADIASCERKLEKNIEQRQVLTSLMASSLLETGVFNQESSALLQEYEKLQAEKENLLYSINGDRTRFDALDNLIKALSKLEMITEFNDEFFLEHVDSIKVLSRTEIVFELKCGLKLKERLVV
ncbi:MAG: recombinase family protein [Anaerovoracaceae bacterium]